MKLTVCLMLLVISGSHVVMAKTPTRPEILKTYEDLLSFRTNSDALLRGGQGVMVIKSSENSALEALDIVVALNNLPVQSVSQLLELSNKADPDNKFMLSLIRDGKSQTLNITKDAMNAVYSDMLPTQVNELMSSQLITDKELSSGQDVMIHEYLKGRPYRTPNNRKVATKQQK